MSKVVVLMSGGMDSSVLAAALRDDGETVHGLAVHYGQRHAREIEASRRVAEWMGVHHLALDLGGLRRVMQGSSQTDETVPLPHGHYTDESMKATVVPNRNMILLAVATAHAVSVGADAVAYAAHSGDHPIYPDCRPVFMRAMEKAMAVCDDNPPCLLAPFAELNKAHIVRVGASLGVPFGLTRSCYDDQPEHCGKCGTCVERREAFVLAEVDDPTEYMS
jgi:7-cyano-7-deazaguanine synthase